MGWSLAKFVGLIVKWAMPVPCSLKAQLRLTFDARTQARGIDLGLNIRLALGRLGQVVFSHETPLSIFIPVDACAHSSARASGLNWFLCLHWHDLD